MLGVPVFGALSDKNWPEICRILAPLAAKIFTAPACQSETGPADASELAAAFQNLRIRRRKWVVCITFSEALNVRQQGRASFVVVTRLACIWWAERKLNELVWDFHPAARASVDFSE